MSNRRRIKAKRKRSKHMGKQVSTLLQRLTKLLVRNLLFIPRRYRLSKSGFVLPTVTMVLLVVIILTTAMVLRSFDRTRIASNTRASQAAVNAATPAIARARVKIEELLKDPTLPQGNLSDLALYNAIKNNPRYTLGDETRLRLTFDIDRDNIIQANDTKIENDETLTTAWRFAVDTDNNGKFDSFTLYGIYFRSPSRATTGEVKGNFNRAINPLEARMPPVAAQAADSPCADILDNSNNLLGDSGWYKSGSKLKKSFFVYTASVPITNNTGLDNQFETFTGNSSFSALEYQQDQSRIPLNNYVAWFDNDLQLTPGTDFRLNGRVHTNGNLLVGGHNNAIVRFYQVSSENSCFYQQENGKITVGGNVGNGNISDIVDQSAVDVDLFDDNPDNNNAQIGSTNKSTESSGGFEVAYNNAAYNQRIALMKQTALSYCIETGNYCSATNLPRVRTVLAIKRYPQEVKNKFKNRIEKNISDNNKFNTNNIFASDRLEDYTNLNTYNVLAEEIELYLKRRTRRVPFAEVRTQDAQEAIRPYKGNIDIRVFPDSNTIEPPVEWRDPTYENTKLQLKTRQLEATWPEQQQQDGKETYLGDRILVGNNLPGYWKDGKNYITAPRDRQLIAGINWTQPNDKPRYRSTEVQLLDTIGISERDGFWEEKAAENPANSLADSGGLRIITGAGIYQHKGNPSSSIKPLQTDSFLPNLPSKLDSGKDIPKPPEELRLAGESLEQYTLVWSDLMPMTGGVEQGKPDIRFPDLRMRATAVYHYQDTSYTDTEYINRTPTACISSYYDPTNSLTARNPVGLPDVSGDLTVRPLPPQPAEGVGRSNNGVVYPAPYSSNSGRFSAIATYLPELKAQAKLMFPNGRLVNEPLQNALRRLSANGTLADSRKPLSLAENSAIDTAICSLKILDGTLAPLGGNPVIPHGAIREASFLDGREVKALSRDASSTSQTTSTSQDANSTDYNLELEQRQPLEIRVTEINLDTDETKGITRKEFYINEPETKEYVLPNSGIIYASREDALRDDSEALTEDSKANTLVRESDRSNESKLLSPTDFKLDSTRRANGIRLINGSNLSRTEENTYRKEEKGLILVTNLPVYVKGNFNVHKTLTGNKLEEFLETLVPSNWSNFYTRRAEELNPNFACRRGQPGCPNTDGDTWRPATIISDAVTLLSDAFRDGFRNQGDYDLNNNAYISTTEEAQQSSSVQQPQQNNSITQKRRKNGFWDNNFVTSAEWWDTNSNGNPYPNQKTNDSYVGSYLANGVTPVQRRTNFSEYVMEICRKIPAETCGESDWVAGYDYDGDRILKNTNQWQELEVKAEDLLKGNIPGGAKVERLGAGTTARPALVEADRRYARRIAFLRNKQPGGAKTPSNTQPGGTQTPSNTQPGETQTPSDTQPGETQTPGGTQTPSNTQPGETQPSNSPSNPTGSPPSDLNINLIISQNSTQTPAGNQSPNGTQPPSGTQPGGTQPGGVQPGNAQPDGNPPAIPLGISDSGTVREFPYDGSGGKPRQVPNALWFKTTNNSTDPTQGGTYSPNNPLFIKEVVNGQPLLVPVLQIHSPDGSPGDSLDRGNPNGYVTNWLQTAAEDTTFNATFVSGNSPGRPEEEPAGLPNFVRFLENWQEKRVNIAGSFVQMWRSAYATAPFATILRDKVTAATTETNNLSLFDYSINTYRTNNGTPAGTVPYYGEPIRQWGFDVALLSQSPDLFAQRFTTPSTSSPNEFFREVGKDDPWIQTLLCAATASDRVGKSTATYNQYAVPDKNLRPAACQNNAPLYQDSSINQASN